MCTLRVSNQNTNWYSINQLSQHTELVTTSTSYMWTLTQGFCVEKILPLEDKFVWLHYIQKGNSSNIHNVIKYLTIRLSGDNTATSVRCLCFVLKNIQNFVDLDACKQLFVLNSYKSQRLKKTEVKKNHKSMIFLE